MTTLSAYEIERLTNIEKNKAHLAALGLEDAAKALRTQPAGARKRPRVPAEPKPPPPPSSRSSRSRGPPLELSAVPAELDDRVEEADDDEPGHFAERLKRPSNMARLTDEQMAKLDKLEPVSASPLSDAELKALDGTREDLTTKKTAGGWQAHSKKGTSMWGEKRAILLTASSERKLRWPTWLGAIESALPPMGSTQSARDQTMYAIERAACGLGLDYRAWPEGVGVLLAFREGTSPRPRLLTLGSDTEALRREGQRLEHLHGRDAGNGWAYNHALNKLRLYQEKLLKELWQEEPSAPSVRELEEAGNKVGMPAAAAGRQEDADDADDDAPLANRRKVAPASLPTPPPQFAFREGQRVEVRIADKWQPARVDNVNEEEDEATYDVVLDDGEEEDGVGADRLRAV